MGAAFDFTSVLCSSAAGSVKVFFLMNWCSLGLAKALS